MIAVEESLIDKISETIHFRQLRYKTRLIKSLKIQAIRIISAIFL